MNKKIWCLFSIDNDYNQPNNNLIAWWNNKPTFFHLAAVLDIEIDLDNGNKIIGQLSRGLIVRYINTDYRLEEIKEGKIL